MSSNSGPVQTPEGGLVFKDQPDGRCLECRWNESATPEQFWCKVPYAHMSNPVCIQKYAMITIIQIKDQDSDEPEGAAPTDD